jgi:hypothetical protein
MENQRLVAGEGNARRKENSKMSSPKKRFRCGGVAASVWENERTADGRTFTVESVTFSRRYKKNDGSWDSSSSFRPNDLPKLQVVCVRAYEYLNAKEPDRESETQ